MPIIEQLKFKRNKVEGYDITCESNAVSKLVYDDYLEQWIFIPTRSRLTCVYEQDLKQLSAFIKTLKGGAK